MSFFETLTALYHVQLRLLASKRSWQFLISVESSIIILISVHTGALLSVIKASTEASTLQQTIPDYTMTLIVGFLAVIIVVAIGVVLLYRKK